jgi:DNA helicase-2/ATP-dependent DNA helicase PcrA
LTRHNDTARALRSFFNRRILLWEGYTRSALEELIDGMQADQTPESIAAGIVTFMGAVSTGFSPTAFGDRFQREVRGRCTSRATGKPATLQGLASLVIGEPNHHGVAKMLERLHELVETDPVFKDIKLDCHKEFWDAVRLGDFETPEIGLADLAHRRAYSRPKPPARAISTVHKAKGLECDSVILVPCDLKTFPDKPDARCLLYVALSRAKKELMLVVSHSNPSPLLII